MSSDDLAGVQREGKAIPWTKRFRRKASTPTLTTDELRRQDSVLGCAWRNLGQSGRVVAFLNGHNERLEGQPLHVAIASDEGLARVETLLNEIGPLNPITKAEI